MLEKNKKVGEYTLLEKLGAGNFGEVWKAEKRTELSVSYFALKFFRPKDDDSIDLAIVKKEVQTWQSLNGLQNVISVIEANKFENYVYIVSEFAEGGSLEKWLKDNGGKARSYEEAVAFTRQILQGLEGMHGEGFVHRDLKPANVLLKRKIFHLADFGISRQMKTHSKTNSTAGTYEFMPPEAFDKKPSVSVHTDIWAVGAILQKLLTGQLPFPQDETPSLIAAILMSEPEPLPEPIPQKLREIVGKALQKKREDRFQSANEMHEALRDVSTFTNLRPNTIQNELKTLNLLDNAIFQQRSRVNDEKTEHLVIEPTKDWREIKAKKEFGDLFERERIATDKLKQLGITDVFEEDGPTDRKKYVSWLEKEVQKAEIIAKKDLGKNDEKKENSLKPNNQSSKQLNLIDFAEKEKPEKQEFAAKNGSKSKLKILRRLLFIGCAIFTILAVWFGFLVNPIFRETAQWQDLRYASLLLTLGADVNSKGNSDRTALHLNVRKENTANITWLLSRGADIDSRNFMKQTSLIEYAGSLSNLELDIVKLLIKNGANVNARDDRGHTALIYSSIQAENFEVVKFLIEQGADVNVIGGDNALMFASANSNFEIVKLLIDKGVNINAKNIRGGTALIETGSWSGGNKWCVRDKNNICQDGDSMKILRLLIDNGAEINVADNEGDTALMQMVNYYTSAVSLLIEKGADVNVRNKRGQTVLGVVRERLKNSSEDNKSFYNQVIEILQSAGATE